MLKPVLGLAATGIVALILFKIIALFLLPLIGITIGLVLIAIKVAFWVLVGMFAVWVFRRLSRREVAAS
jgi:type III secretory pathway component EscV